MDLVIQENDKYNSMANPNQYYIGDIKTGKSSSGSTYGRKQMNKNQNNILRQESGKWNGSQLYGNDRECRRVMGSAISMTRKTDDSGYVYDYDFVNRLVQITAPDG